ncbi:MAG TPA: hypothetical protein VFX60_04905 [Micromonospora sp.]|nr:hypothetical protein [Micromonospora sp.]
MVLITLAGLGLGLFSFLGDELPGLTGTIILAVVSTSAAWGASALIAGSAVRHRRSAPTAGMTVLLIGTAGY